MNVLEAVLDTISMRLCNLVQCCSMEGVEKMMKLVINLDNVLFPTLTSLLTLYPEVRTRLAQLIIRRNEINELKKKYSE